MTEQQPGGWSKVSRRRRADRATPARTQQQACDNCDQAPGVHPRTDAAGITGRVCDTCQWEPRDALSFA